LLIEKRYIITNKSIVNQKVFIWQVFLYTADMAQSDEEYLSVSETAEILGISRQRVLQLIEAGRLEARKVGNSYIIARLALRAVEGRKPGRPVKDKEAAKKPKAKRK